MEKVAIPPTRGLTKHIAFKASEDTLLRLEREADANMTSVSALIRAVVEAWLNNQGKGGNGGGN